MMKVPLYLKPTNLNFKGHLSHCIMQKKNSKNPIDLSLMFFAFKGNLVIILCNKNIKILIIPVLSFNY
jgi:hypothetical protein